MRSLLGAAKGLTRLDEKALGVATGVSQYNDQRREYLDQHISGARGALRQEPYIRDIFKLFASPTTNHEAAGPNSPQITSDGLVEHIGQRSQQTDTPEHYRKKVELLRRVGAMWAEWDYAWKMYPRFHG